MDMKQAIDFVWSNARPLDRAIFEYRFLDGPPGRVLDILRTYQNADGGFGHALEPDLRTPESQPLFVEFALWTLRDNGLRDAEMASRACDFVARHADFERGIAPIFPSYKNYPHAAHWTNPPAALPTIDRLIGLVGLLNWQGIRHLWLAQAVPFCLERIASQAYTDAHTILPSFILLESVAGEREVEPLYGKLAESLLSCRFFSLRTPVTGYSLTPLDIAPSPGAYCRRIFDDAVIAAHLDELESKQQPDGGWPVTWDPPGPASLWEWRAHGTVKNLVLLRAYGRV